MFAKVLLSGNTLIFFLLRFENSNSLLTHDRHPDERPVGDPSRTVCLDQYHMIDDIKFKQYFGWGFIA